MVHSWSVREFSSNCILNMVSMTEEFFLACPHFCQVKAKTIRLFEQLFQLMNNLGDGPNDVLVGFERSSVNEFQNRNRGSRLLLSSFRKYLETYSTSGLSQMVYQMVYPRDITKKRCSLYTLERYRV